MAAEQLVNIGQPSLHHSNWFLCRIFSSTWILIHLNSGLCWSLFDQMWKDIKIIASQQCQQSLFSGHHCHLLKKQITIFSLTWELCFSSAPLPHSFMLEVRNPCLWSCPKSAPKRDASSLAAYCCFMWARFCENMYNWGSSFGKLTVPDKCSPNCLKIALWLNQDSI